MDNKRPLQAHLSLLAAQVCWGLMSPIGKDAMSRGLSGLDMVTFRVAGAAILFWLSSLVARGEHVPIKDVFKLGAAALFGVTLNQCMFTIGLSFTSPINASIATTSMPIFAMLLSFLILREPLSLLKVSGVAIGCSGAVILILTSISAGSSKVGDIRGDLLCMAAQLSFALYLSLFSKFVKQYSAITVNKWMFTWATLYVLPFSSGNLAAISWQAIPLSVWMETVYVVVMGTFVSYLLMMFAQQTLRPTVVSIYNYVQPIVAVTASVLTGLGVFKPAQGLAIILVFGGVWMVTKSKSRRDVEKASANASGALRH